MPFILWPNAILRSKPKDSIRGIERFDAFAR
jgi:hypothetical protein